MTTTTTTTTKNIINNKEGHNNVFVKFLPTTVDDVQLHDLFSSFGTIVSSKVMVNQITGASLGYGYVSPIINHQYACSFIINNIIEGL